MNEIVARIISRLEEEGIDQKTFASEIGVSPTTITDWKTGKSSSYMKKINIISAALASPLEWLMFGDGPSSKLEAAHLDGTFAIHEKIDFMHSGGKAARIPVLGTIPAGIPIEAVEDVLDWEDIPAKWAIGGRRYFGLKVQGDSMYPKYLDGDTVILLKQDTCESGNDCAVFVNGDAATLKQVYLYEDNSMELRPLNPTYPPRTYTREEICQLPVSIAGVVVELRRKIK